MDYKLIIIGAGPAGYVAAIRAGQTGIKTALIEKEKLGGMCLNWGCIPSKALLESAKFYKKMKLAKEFGIDGLNYDQLSFNWPESVQRAAKITDKLQKGIAHLLKKNEIDSISGEATIIDEHTVEVNGKKISSEYIFIATGSRPAKIDYPIDPKKIVEMDTLLGMKKLPKNIAVIGHSPTAMEMSQLLAMIGHRVSLLVPGEDLLPMLDPVVSDFAGKQLKKFGVDVYLNAKITGDIKNGIKSGKNEIKADFVINSEMRTAILPPAKIKFEMNNQFIKANKWFQTNYMNVFAIGDVNGILPVAHAASAQGINAVDQINGVNEVLDHERIPINIYSEPEIAQVGLTEPQLKARGIDFKDSRFPITANGKAMTEGHPEGFVRILSEKIYGEVLGVQIVSANATDLIAEATAFLQMEGTVFDIAKVVHAHPTVSEVFMEAGFAGTGKPIHI